MEKIPFNTTEKHLKNIYGEPLDDRLNELATAFEWMEKGKLEQVYVVSTEDDLPSIVEQIKNKIGLKDDNVVHLNLTQGNTGGLIEALQKMEDNLKDKDLLIVAKGYADVKIIGHTINQFMHYDFPKLNLGKGLLIIHINQASPQRDAAVATAKDSQFKFEVIEIGY